MDTAALKKLSNQFRIDILNMTHKAGSGHASTALSCIDILTMIYFGAIEGEPIMHFDPHKPQWDGRDYFILSKGHGAPALYAVLAHIGFFPKEELNHLRQINSLLEGHPVIKIPGVEATTGPLGQGISFGNGIAMALKMDKKPTRVYVVLGDGELQEGQIWESAMTAAQHKLDNLIAFVDNNHLQQTNFMRAIKPVSPIGPKFTAFGWNVINVAHGHDFDELRDAIRRAWKVKLRPTIIVCDTVKGKGVPFVENKAIYHGVPLSKEEMAVAVPILEKE
ncbi:transketolase [Candidatus Peregrinibacteria bacterium]|nr:transketolase [Candidatus Peregrinibacteria bacterium]